MSRNSLNALLAYVSFWNGFTSFLIATFSFSIVSNAELKVGVVKENSVVTYQCNYMHTHIRVHLMHTSIPMLKYKSMRKIKPVSYHNTMLIQHYIVDTGIKLRSIYS